MVQSGQRAILHRPALLALISISILAGARSLFCFFMPDVIGGWGTAEASSDRLIFSALFVIGGYYIYFFTNKIRLAMVIMMPGLYMLSNISAFRAQFALFHFGRNYPLIDSSLGYLDSQLLFNWRFYFDWIIAHPTIEWIVSLAYQSIWVQPLLLVLIFISKRRITSFFTLQLALPVSLTLTCAIAAFLPALGAYQFHNMTEAFHPHTTLEFTDQMTKPLMWLRQETLPDAMPQFSDLRLITFPSWHAATAAIFIMSAWSIYPARYIFIPLNVAMLLATPVQGSHYLTDIIVGLFVGFLSQIASSYLLRPRSTVASTWESSASEPAPGFT